MRNFLLSASAFALLLMSGATLAAPCISIAGKKIDPSEIYDARHTCGTCAGQAAKPLLCAAINRMMVPYWSSPADVVSIPHRGLWGRPLSNGPAENTLAAAKAALAAGHRIMEFDALRTGYDATQQRQAMAGRYISMAAFGGRRDMPPEVYSPEWLSQQKMRKRDQSRSWELEDSLTLFPQLLTWAAKNDVLLVVDPWDYPDAHETDLGKLIAIILNTAHSLGALANVAIKTEKDYTQALASVERYVNKYWTEVDGHFLWVPITNQSASKNKIRTLATIADWHKKSGLSRQVLHYQIGLFSKNSWSAASFNDGGKTYQNLIDYVRQLTDLGKRSGVWSQDAMGDKGRINASYNWNFVANSSQDTRGSPYRNLEYAWARHLAVTTDRPDWYDAMVVNPY